AAHPTEGAIPLGGSGIVQAETSCDGKSCLRYPTFPRGPHRSLCETPLMGGGPLTPPDGRTLAWREYGPSEGRPLLRFQGMPGSRNSRHPHEDAYDRLGVRVIVLDRPGYGASTLLGGRWLS